MNGIRNILSELEKICERLNVTVRYEKTSAKGGICMFNSKYIVIIDKKSSDEYKANVLAKSLKTFDLNNLHLKPAVRHFIENAD